MSTESIDRRFLIGALGGAAGIAALSQLAKAGPLNPPPGPIAPTGRTVQEIYDKVARTDAGLAEPRIPVQSLPGSATALHVITQPGSYYLTGNIEGVAGKNGIEILASNVALDLCGHAVVGAPGAVAAIRIGVPDARVSGIVVRNGNIAAWDAAGVEASESFASQFADLVITRAGSVGLITGEQCLVERISVDQSSIGLQTSDFRGGSLFRDCSARRCTNAGFYLFESQAVSCVARDCQQGFQTTFGCLVIDSLAVLCSTGFKAIERTLFHRCLTQECEFAFRAEGFNISIKECRVMNGPHGIILDGRSGNTIENCIVTECVNSIVVTGVNHWVAGNRIQNFGNLYTIAPGNSHGPIVNVAGVGDISAVPHANHPWANFIF